MSDIATQLKLVTTLVAYEAAEELATRFPQVGPQADRLHDKLLKLSLACGFDPAREHRHLTTLQWARTKAEVIQRMFPIHLREIAQSNREAA